MIKPEHNPGLHRDPVRMDPFDAAGVIFHPVEPFVYLVQNKLIQSR